MVASLKIMLAVAILLVATKPEGIMGVRQLSQSSANKCAGPEQDCDIIVRCCPGYTCQLSIGPPGTLGTCKPKTNV